MGREGLYGFHFLGIPTSMGVILCTDRRCATLAFAHGITKASISASLITMTTQPMVGVPRITGTLAAKLESPGLLGLSDPHHSPELHLPEPGSPHSRIVLCRHCLALHRQLWNPIRSVIGPICSE